MHEKAVPVDAMETDDRVLMDQIRQSIQVYLEQNRCDVDRIVNEIRIHQSPEAVQEPIAAGPAELASRAEPAFYTYRDLLDGNEDAFIERAYRTLLQRTPDGGGMAAYREMLYDKRGDRILVLGSIRYSSEGKEEGVPVKGLWIRYVVRKLVWRLRTIPILRKLVWRLRTIPILRKFVWRLKRIPILGNFFG